MHCPSLRGTRPKVGGGNGIGQKYTAALWVYHTAALWYHHTAALY